MITFGNEYTKRSYDWAVAGLADACEFLTARH